MTYEELNAEIEKIDYTIGELTNSRYELRKQQMEIFKNEAQKHVGRCFKNCSKEDSKYVKVIDVPRIEHVGFPALYLTEKGSCPFTHGTLHSNVLDGNSSYEEISQDEFNAEFKRCINEYKNKIITTGDKTCLTCRMYNNPSDFLCTSCGKEYSNYEPVENDLE